MPERFNVEEPIHPFSITSAYRTSTALFEVFRDRPAPPFAFSLSLLIWGAGLLRIFAPAFAQADACVDYSLLFHPDLGEWRTYLGHLLYPLEPGFVRGFFTSALLLVEGYTLEHELGSLHFASIFLGLQLASAAVVLHFRLVPCVIGIESALVATALVMHRVNPKVHTDGLDKGLRVPFAIEPRWHVWALQSILLLSAGNFPRALVIHAAALAMGGLLALRDPEVWLFALRGLKARSFGLGASLHSALLLFALFFAPLSAAAQGGGGGLPALAGIGEAIFSGDALRWSWWKASFPGSPPLVHLAVDGLISPEAFFLCKLLIAFGSPLLLSPFRLWSKIYAGACLLLAMYSMISPLWRLPHVGFLVLLYLVYAFWQLPSLTMVKPHHA